MSGLLLGGLVSLALCGIAGAWGYYKFVRLERRTRQAERLGELGMLTAGLAHEIKNPLSTLQLNLQLLREQLDDRISGLDDLIGLPAAAAGDLEERRKVLARMIRRLDGVTNEAGRLREILDGFLRYAGRIEAQPQPVDLARLAVDLDLAAMSLGNASRDG
jgi:signal transduction histidine kinase